MPLPEDGYGLLPVIEVDPALLTNFRCGAAHLDSFLAQAADFHRARLGLTTVAFHRDVAGVVGYFTLANDALPLTTSEQGELNVDVVLKAYPAVKLGRLAVASHLQGQGIGEQLMAFIHGEILDSDSLSAARLVIVDADSDSRVVAFYRKSGYQESLWAESQAKSHRPGKPGTPSATVKMIRDILV
jgi:GNAT superfamily N-acetyltransferase